MIGCRYNYSDIIEMSRADWRKLSDDELNQVAVQIALNNPLVDLDDFYQKYKDILTEEEERLLMVEMEKTFEDRLYEAKKREGEIK